MGRMRWVVTGVSVLGIIPAGLGAAPDITITMAEQFYSQNKFVVSTGVDADAVIDHRLDGEGVRWGFGSGVPVRFFSTQYPGPDDCPIGEPRLVRVRHLAHVGESDDEVLAALNYECTIEPL